MHYGWHYSVRFIPVPTPLFMSRSVRGGIRDVAVLAVLASGRAWSGRGQEDARVVGDSMLGWRRAVCIRWWRAGRASYTQLLPHSSEGRTFQFPTHHSHMHLPEAEQSQ